MADSDIIYYYCCKVQNPLTSKTDEYLISPYIITLEPHIKVTRITEMITNLRSSVLLTNSPSQHLRKDKENSMENMHTDIRV